MQFFITVNRNFWENGWNPIPKILHFLKIFYMHLILALVSLKLNTFALAVAQFDLNNLFLKIKNASRVFIAWIISEIGIFHELVFRENYNKNIFQICNDIVKLNKTLTLKHMPHIICHISNWRYVVYASYFMHLGCLSQLFWQTFPR